MEKGEGVIMRKKVLIVGAGAQARIVIDILQYHEKEIEIFGILDISDEGKITSKEIMGIKLLGGLEMLPKLRQKVSGVVIAYGDNKKRKEVKDKVLSLGYELVSAIHPSAIISKNCKVGKGVMMSAGVIINPGASVGDNCIINTAVTIDHDCIVEDEANISPGANLAGKVRVGKGVFMGIGATVIDKKSIGDWSVIGAGAVVIDDIPPGVTVVGVPAKKIIKS